MSRRILVVDDEIESVKLIGLMLQRRGYEIVAARSGAQALEKAQAEKPDLVVLDVMMPDMDGYEVCRRLRADPGTATLPIIMFTAKTMIDDKVAGFQAGADDYLTKPVHPEELASRIEAVLLRTSRRQVEESPPIRAKIFGFLGSKGGVGTTTLAVNTAVALAQEHQDQQVILADMHPGMSATAIEMGLRRHGGIKRLLEQPAEQIGARAVEAQLEEHKSGVRVLWGELDPVGVATPLLPEQAERIVQHLGAMADYLLLDLGVGLTETNRHILPNCRHIVVAIEPHRVALMLAQALLDQMTSGLTLPRHRISVVLINKAASASTFTKDAIEGLLQHDLAGVVTPAPELAFQAAESGNPMVAAQPTSLVAQQLRNIAEYIVNV
jgi:CheY-like chemotaxis protein/MinD-like ATPase involved in chromosome partitioning or flagellar assembly